MKRTALEYAVFLITRRPQTEQEIITKLTRKKFSADEIRQAVGELTRVKLLDDRRYAKTYVGDKVEFNRRGRYRISIELLRKGVDKEIAEEALGQLSKETELKSAQELIESRQRLWANLDPQKRYQRAVSLLQRRGFSIEIIKKVLTML